MKITMVGTGYVGLVSGACLAEVGNQVMCFDIDPQKIAMLNAGELPIYEPGLADIIKRNYDAGRLCFSSDIEQAVAYGKIQFIAVGTPQEQDGSADLQQVLAAAANIGRHMQDYKVVVNKSTVPVGAADRVAQVIRAELSKRALSTAFSVVSNPEFLKEGDAVEDFMRPERVVIGVDDAYAAQLMRQLYQPFQRNRERLLVMDVRSAELAKYAANAMLATRISFMNEMANLAERLGADIEWVRQAIGADSRIGYHFLYPGVGYGGSCFPKDIKALCKIADEHGMELQVVTAVDRVNHRQKRRLLVKLARYWGDIWHNRRVALWGLAFKPNTDDVREASSLTMIEQLLAKGVRISAYDPVAVDAVKRILGNRIHYAHSPLDAAEDADALLIVTEWKEFRSPDFELLKSKLKRPLILDGRNLYDPMTVRGFGFEYEAIGRLSKPQSY